MKKWTTIFFIFGIIFILLAVVSLAGTGLIAAVGMIVSAISFFFLSRLSKSIAEILDNQKKLIIMVDNLKE